MIRVDEFHGAFPRRSARLLAPGEAVKAENARLTSGSLRPLRAPLHSTTLPHVGTVESLHRFPTGDWFAWTGDVDAVRGAIPTDTIARTYFTGDGVPKVTSTEIATTSGDGVYPTAAYDLGVPAPTIAPTTQVDPSWSGDIEENSEEFHVYVYTYVSGWGEEGPPSDPSVRLARQYDTDGNLLPVEVTMGAGPSGAYNIVSKRLYRVNVGSTGQDFQLVATLPVATTPYVDSINNDNLSTVLLETVEWDPPPATGKGILMLPNGVAAMFDGLDVYLSVPYQPHAWPRSYMQTVDAPIVGLGSFGNTIVVCTEHRPYLLQGVDPASMSLVELEIEQACISKRSISRMGLEGVVYASPDGLVLVGPGGARVVTHDWYTREEWQALKPETLIGFSLDQNYIGFYDDGATKAAIMIGTQFRGVVTIPVAAVGGWHDPLADALYILPGDGTVKVFDAGAAGVATWGSGIFRGDPVNLAYAQVLFRHTPAGLATLRVYADGALKHTATGIGSSNAFPLPSGFLAREWAFEIEATDEVDAVIIGDAMDTA